MYIFIKFEIIFIIDINIINFNKKINKKRCPFFLGKTGIGENVEKKIWENCGLKNNLGKAKIIKIYIIFFLYTI